MSLERVIDAVIALGVTRSDAKLYIYLALHGPLKAKAIINGTGSYKKQVYESIRVLRAKGLVFASDDIPRIFCALTFEKLLDLLADKKRNDACLLENKREELLCSWKKMVEDDSLVFNLGLPNRQKGNDQSINC